MLNLENIAKRKLISFFIFFTNSIMGLIGGSLGSIAGAGLGQAIGQKYGGNLGGQVGRDLGRVGGGALGALLPFKNGGRVTRTTKALLHKGEIVVPAKYAKDVSKSLKAKIKANGGRNM
jgi:hypothetical protein